MTLTERWDMLINEIKHEIATSGNSERWLNETFYPSEHITKERLVYRTKVESFRKVLAIMDQLTELQHLEKGGKNDLQ